MLSPDSLTMAQNKIQAIQDWPKPHKVQDIMSFLRFANFYHCFIYGYSEITVLLMLVLGKFGLVWSQAFFFRTGDRTIQSQTKFLGLGPGLPGPV